MFVVREVLNEQPPRGVKFITIQLLAHISIEITDHCCAVEDHHSNSYWSNIDCIHYIFRQWSEQYKFEIKLYKWPILLDAKTVCSQRDGDQNDIVSCKSRYTLSFVDKWPKSHSSYDTFDISVYVPQCSAGVWGSASNLALWKEKKTCWISDQCWPFDALHLTHLYHY